MEVSGEHVASTALSPGSEPLVPHCVGGWLGPRAVLDPVAKRKISYLCRESNSGRPARTSVTVVTPQQSSRGYLNYYCVVRHSSSGITCSRYVSDVKLSSFK